MNKEETCQYLKDHGITFETTEHKAVFNMEELAEVKLPYPEWDAKNLFVRDGKKRTVSRKILPGYILIEMDLPDDGWKAPCSAIRKITGVTGFVGSNLSNKPQPIPSEEVKRILQRSGDIKGERQTRMKQTYSPGEQVKIIDGPFESFSGVIEEVNPEKNKLKVMVGIFGRSTPVEVEMTQVEKV